MLALLRGLSGLETCRSLDREAFNASSLAHEAIEMESTLFPISVTTILVRN
jgi:hypothetical protein